MVLPMIGIEYLSKLGKSLNGNFKKLFNPLFKDGIGDKMDKGNLWIVPSFTVLAFAILWATKLSKLALAESSCRGASIYDFSGTELDEDAQRHCQTAKRYFVGINEPISYDQKWREERQVKNPEWILWFWAPIVFVMYVLTRYLWSLLMENQGINFNNVVNASQGVMVENDGIIKIDKDKLNDRAGVIADNFRCASSSNAFAAFLVFEISLVLAPVFLLLVILPLMIGGGYRTWGLDVARAWYEKKEWQGSQLTPFFETFNSTPVTPLIPRITYCDYHFITLGNDHILTYRCYLDANWHERTALFTWIMLIFLTFINLINLIFWILWSIRMRFGYNRQEWIKKKWLNGDDDSSNNELVEDFASRFKMGNLLLFYFIEAHTDRVVASAFAKNLYKNWLKKQQQQRPNVFVVHMPKAPSRKNRMPKAPARNVGWKISPHTPQPNVGLPEAKSVGWTLSDENLDQDMPKPNPPLSESSPSPSSSSSSINSPPSSASPQSSDTPPSYTTDLSTNSTAKLVDSPKNTLSRGGKFYRSSITRAMPISLEPPEKGKKISPTIEDGLSSTRQSTNRRRRRCMIM